MEVASPTICANHERLKLDASLPCSYFSSEPSYTTNETSSCHLERNSATNSMATLTSTLYTSPKGKTTRTKQMMKKHLKSIRMKRNSECYNFKQHTRIKDKVAKMEL